VRFLRATRLACGANIPHTLCFVLAGDDMSRWRPSAWPMLVCLFSCGHFILSGRHDSGDMRACGITAGSLRSFGTFSCSDGVWFIFFFVYSLARFCTVYACDIRAIRGVLQTRTFPLLASALLFSLTGTTARWPLQPSTGAARGHARMPLPPNAAQQRRHRNVFTAGDDTAAAAPHPQVLYVHS